MPIIITRNDITRMQCDAIVNAANRSLLGGGGVDGAIHKAAGPKLLEECRGLGGCEPGQAKITGAYDLPSRYVIHTVGPIWQGGKSGEREILASCYSESLCLAYKSGCESIAFPLISSGIYGYPVGQAMQVALETIRKYLEEHEMLVYLVVFGRQKIGIDENLFVDINDYISKHAVLEETPYVEMPASQDSSRSKKTKIEKWPTIPAFGSQEVEACISSDSSETLDKDMLDAVSHLNESFSQMLLRKIDEKGMTDVECYKKANIDRKLFSKIRSERYYRPSKSTAIAFAIALELDVEQTREMLLKAGFALSPSSRFDVIIDYFIRNHRYDIIEINQALFAFDQPLLGG